VGRAVPLHQLPASAGLAELAAELWRSGALTGDPVLVEEHLDTVIVHRDPRLLDLLRGSTWRHWMMPPPPPG